MSSTRNQVLKTLLIKQKATVIELADAVGINPISVRHHLTKLENDDLIDSEVVRHGVGRPHQVYFLTEKGLEQFPSRYISLTIRLLEQLKESLPKSMVNKLFANIAEEMAKEYAESFELEDLTLDDRLELVKLLLNKEGFTVELDKKKDHYLIREVSCPYLHIGQSHPEVCLVDQTLISNLLNVPTQKINCILDGDSLCTYVVPNITAEG